MDGRDAWPLPVRAAERGDDPEATARAFLKRARPHTTLRAVRSAVQISQDDMPAPMRCTLLAAAAGVALDSPGTAARRSPVASATTPSNAIFRTGRLLAPSMPVSSSTLPARPPQPS